MNYKTRGIIINRKNLGEADRVLTVFTEKRGKIKAIAKGVRKTLSKLAGHLEPFCVTNFSLAEGRNFDVVTEAQVVKSYCALREDLSCTNLTYYLAEIIDKMVPEEERHQEVFHLLEETLDKVNIGPAELLSSYFIINFLSTMGFKPELHYCVNCRKEIGPTQNYFNFDLGGVLCADCKKDGFEVSNEAIKVLRLFIKHEIEVAEKIKANKQLVKEVVDLSNRYLVYINQKEFNAQRFLSK